MTFAERRRFELDYKEWLKRESVINGVRIEDCALSVIGYLDSKGLINKMPKWIPVSDGLPNERENVLVYCQENQCIFTAVLDRQAWHYFGGVGYDFIPWKVIAWMPLPESYKESEDKE